MIWQDYVKLTTEFNTYPVEDQLTTLLVGLAEELIEYNLASQDEVHWEAGDVLWYVSEISNLLDVELFLNPRNRSSNIQFDVKEILSCVKKYRRGDFGEPERRARVISTCASVLNDMAGAHRSEFPFILTCNISKLTDRRNRDKIKGSGDHR
jgi:NTP pyrophosphatase (non-canonical NTP hydrolase)